MLITFFFISALAFACVMCFAAWRALYPESQPISPVELNEDVFQHNLTSLDRKYFPLWQFATASPKGCILLVHGYGANAHQVFGIAASLQARGYEALVIELRGHGRRPGPFTFGEREWCDLQTVIDWATHQAKLSKCPLGIVGLSTGAYIACRLVQHNPHAVKAVVLDSLFSSMHEMLRLYIHEKYRLPEKFFGTLAWWSIQIAIKQPLAEYEPEALARNLRQPLLAIHSRADTRVPPLSAEAWYQNWKGPKQRWILEHSAHVEAFKDHPETYIDKLCEFFGEKL